MYLSKSDEERDYDWEEKFAKNYVQIKFGVQVAIKALIACEEWNKLLFGLYVNDLETDDTAARHILRLVETRRESLEKEKQEKERGKNVDVQVGNKMEGVHRPQESAPVGYTASAAVTTKPPPPTNDTPPTPPESTSHSEIGKLPKKPVGDEDKKSEEKGKR